MHGILNCPELDRVCKRLSSASCNKRKNKKIMTAKFKITLEHVPGHAGLKKKSREITRADKTHTRHERGEFNFKIQNIKIRILIPEGKGKRVRGGNGSEASGEMT